MIAPLLLTVALLHQAPAAPEPPLTLLVAPLDARGVPSRVVKLGQKHLEQEVKARGAQVTTVAVLARQLPPKLRKALLKCKRTQPSCLSALAAAAQSQGVVVAELRAVARDYSVTLRVHGGDGALMEQHSLKVPKKNLDLLSAISQSVGVVLPQVRERLRPPAPVQPEEPTQTADPAVGSGTAQTEDPTVGNGTAQTADPVAVRDPGGTQGSAGTQGSTGVRNPLPPKDPTGPRNPLVSPTPSVRAERPGPPGWAWAPGAVGVLAAGAGGLMLFQADGLYRQLTSGSDITDGPQLRDRGNMYKTLGYAGIGVGAAGVAASALLYLLPGTSAPVHPTATLTPHGGSVGVAGTLP